MKILEKKNSKAFKFSNSIYINPSLEQKYPCYALCNIHRHELIPLISTFFAKLRHLKLLMVSIKNGGRMWSGRQVCGVSAKKET